MISETWPVDFDLWQRILFKNWFGIANCCLCAVCHFRENVLKLKTDNKLWLFICIFLSGVFGGGYGLPLVVYGNMWNWSTKHFRATLQAYFLPVSFIGSLGYFAEN